MNHLRRLLALVTLTLCACLALSCGGDDPGGIGLDLHFSPRDLPADADKLRYYVLPSELTDGSPAACEDFMGTDAEKSIYVQQYTTRGDVDVDGQADITISILDLPQDELLFYVEALNQTLDTIACGCGQGEIKDGEKTFIPIRLVDDCRG